MEYEIFPCMPNWEKTLGNFSAAHYCRKEIQNLSDAVECSVNTEEWIFRWAGSIMPVFCFVHFKMDFMHLVLLWPTLSKIIIFAFIADVNSNDWWMKVPASNYICLIKKA